MLTTIDLFAGAGGLSLGFQQTGKVKIVAAAEINRNAAKTYIRNLQKVNEEPIEMIENVIGHDFLPLLSKYGTIDLVIGGPPCQGFSNANRQKNHVISMNNILIKEYFRAIKELQPRAFVMENVSMLQSDTHRFYDSQLDHEDVETYQIKMRPDKILVVPADIIDGEVEFLEIINDRAKLGENMISEKLYSKLRILNKNHTNPKRLPRYIQANKTVLVKMIKAALEGQITEYNSMQLNIILKALGQEHYQMEDCASALSSLVATQKAFRRAKEINDNKIIHRFEQQEDGDIIAQVQSYSVIDYINAILGDTYKQVGATVNALWFGVPQDRKRYITMGIRTDVLGNREFKMLAEPADYPKTTVEDAIFDLKDYPASEAKEPAPITISPFDTELTRYAIVMRDSEQLYNHIITSSTPEAIRRFKAIPEGENFHSLSEELITTYSNPNRTQNTIYLRLNRKAPAGTVVNVRKSMWIHPVLDRAISVREAARLQSFPDSFIFCGTKDSQYQQVGNAVPPMLARAIANHIISYL